LSSRATLRIDRRRDRPNSGAKDDLRARTFRVGYLAVHLVPNIASAPRERDTIGLRAHVFPKDRGRMRTTARDLSSPKQNTSGQARTARFDTPEVVDGRGNVRRLSFLVVLAEVPLPRSLNSPAAPSPRPAVRLFLWPLYGLVRGSGFETGRDGIFRCTRAYNMKRVFIIGGLLCSKPIG
jgi:hypothetical protein